MDFRVQPRDKTPSQEWHTANSLCPKKARMSKSKIKSMLICFFDSQGIIHKEFVPPGQTVNQTFYREVLERLRKRVARVRPGIARTWMLHHSNAPCHTAVSINEFLAEKSIPVVPQPSYSPDLSPYDFFLFPRLKNHLKGRHFITLGNIQKSITDELKAILAEAFQHCYEQWKQCLRCCVAAQGNYFMVKRKSVSLLFCHTTYVCMYVCMYVSMFICMYVHMCIIQKYHMALSLNKDKDEEETGRKHGGNAEDVEGDAEEMEENEVLELATHLHNEVRGAVERVLMSTKNPCA